MTSDNIITPLPIEQPVFKDNWYIKFTEEFIELLDKYDAVCRELDEARRENLRLTLGLAAIVEHKGMMTPELLRKLAAALKAVAQRCGG
jgi:hypothetical protein